MGIEKYTPVIPEPDVDPAEYVPEQDPEFEDILWSSVAKDWRDDPAQMHAFMVEAAEPGWIGEIEP